MASLKEYVSRMKDNQKYIYYITGENVSSLKASYAPLRLLLGIRQKKKEAKTK